MADSLTDFVAVTPARPRSCAVCRVPGELRGEIDAGLRAGIGPTIISRWLTAQKDTPLTTANISYHKAASHHLETA